MSQTIEAEVGKWFRPFVRFEVVDAKIWEKALRAIFDPDGYYDSDEYILASSDVRFRQLKGEVQLLNALAKDVEAADTPLGPVDFKMTISNGKKQVLGIPACLQLVLEVNNLEEAEKLRGVSVELLLAGKPYYLSSFSDDPEFKTNDQWINTYQGDGLLYLFNKRLENLRGVQRNVILPFNLNDRGRLSEIRSRFIDKQAPVEESVVDSGFLKNLFL